MILDSGNRREFESGAVRDMNEEKGRCDLIPLDVAAVILGDDVIIENIYRFQRSGLVEHLYEALRVFVALSYGDVETMLLELAKHFAEGAKKYGEHNWQKGLPINCYIDSAVRHYLKWRRGDDDEHHDRAFCWNVVCCIWEADRQIAKREVCEDDDESVESEK